MKKEKLLKLVMVLIMGIVLLASSVNVFALEDEDDGFEFFNDITDDNVIDSNSTEPEEETETKSETNLNDNKNTTNNYDTNLPKAGVAENTFAGIAITVLTITAVYAYKKINEYKNI